MTYPYLLIDTYVADPVGRKSLISHYTCNMLKSMGLQNGTAFFQALPYNGKIYFHEMGYRLSGGMLFKFTLPLMGINDMKMMTRFTLGGPMLTDEEKAKLDVACGRQYGVQLNVPLNVGSIEGLEDCKALPCMKDFIQYYHVGDTVEEKVIGTLGQHFGRFTMIAQTEQELDDAVQMINRTLFIRDTDGNEMNSMKFDLARKKTH